MDEVNVTDSIDSSNPEDNFEKAVSKFEVEQIIVSSMI